MKILVLGSAGMLGHVLTLDLIRHGHEVTSLSQNRKIIENTILLDLTDSEKLDRFLDRNDFDIVINCSAILVKQSEIEKFKAIYINSLLPHKLEERYIHTETKIIHVSTDGVFSGQKGYYTEGSFPDATTFYGRTKIVGEIDNNKDLTIRGSFIGPDISIYGTGLLNWFFQQTGTVKGFDGVYFNGVTSTEFAAFIDIVLNSDLSGIYHLCANERISKGQLLRKYRQALELKDIDIVSDTNINSDNTLVNSRTDLCYKQKSYSEMINEQIHWINSNRDLYLHYRFCQ